ncbi:MAG: polysaccharide deacetylase family protein [Candidatus Binatia bacterium]
MRLSCCITFDFDAMSVWIGSMCSNNPSMISRGEFGAVAVPRILDLLKRHRMRTTWCVPGHTALAYPDLVRRIRDEGHEIAHHGWVHENPARLDEAEERRVLERGFEALDRVAGVRPRGYRSPAWDLSPRTVALLLEYGFEWDSSLMGSDFFPYWVRTGDRWSPDEPYVFGEPTRLVELPVTWGLDDFPPFEFILGSNAGLSAPSKVEEIWRGDFDWAYANCPGGLYNLTLHPQVIGRGHRMLMLERLIGHFEKHAGVVFETLGDVAGRWRQGDR